MSPRFVILCLMSIGSTAGAYIPLFFGYSAFSFTSIGWSAIGGVLGVYIGYRMVGDQF